MTQPPAHTKVVCYNGRERLRRGGLRVWFDRWEIRPVESIRAKIEAGLEHSRLLVLCMSPEAFGSDPGAPGLEAGTLRWE